MLTNRNIIRLVKTKYSSSDKFSRLIKRLTSSKLYRFFVKHWIKRQASSDNHSGPYNLVIELSNVCNAQCLMCPHRNMHRPLKVMDEKTFTLLINQLTSSKLKFNKLLISGMGEPLADKQLINRLTALKQFGIPIRLYTNASLLTKSISKELVNLGLEEINISFNGATPKIYHQVMALDYTRTIANIDDLLKAKKQLKSQLPKVQISLIITKENAKQVTRYLALWRKKVDSVTVSKSHQWGGGVTIQSGFDQTESDLTYPCRSLWHTITLDCSGNFVICCRDYESSIVLGNLKTNTFDAILNHPIRQKFKTAHLYYSKKALPAMCQKCNFPYQDGVEWLIPRSYD